MRAIRFHKFGDPAEVLKLEEMPLPEPERGEVRVRMLASPINPSDLMTVRGNYGRLPELPATPGFEGVGIVEASGGGLFGRYLVGKRVAVLGGASGNWREQTVVPARQAIPLPGDLPVEQGAMFFVNPATAYIMTRQVLRVPQGEWLLQTAAGSALGRMVIRLGGRFGFRTLNVVRREEQIEELKQLGGDAVIAFDGEKAEAEVLAGKVKEATGRNGVRYVIDPVGGETGSAVVECLGSNGRLLVFGTLSERPLVLSPRVLMTQTARVEGFWLARWMVKQSVVGKLRLVRAISRLMREGTLVSEVERTFSLGEIGEGVRFAESSGRRGKALLRIAGE